MFKELYNKQLYTYHLDSIIILLYLLYIFMLQSYFDEFCWQSIDLKKI